MSFMSQTGLLPDVAWTSVRNYSLQFFGKPGTSYISVISIASNISKEVSGESY